MKLIKISGTGCKASLRLDPPLLIDSDHKVGVHAFYYETRKLKKCDLYIDLDVTVNKDQKKGFSYKITFEEGFWDLEDIKNEIKKELKIFKDQIEQILKSKKMTITSKMFDENKLDIILFNGGPQFKFYRTVVFHTSTELSTHLHYLFTNDKIIELHSNIVKPNYANHDDSIHCHKEEEFLCITTCDLKSKGYINKLDHPLYLPISTEKLDKIEVNLLDVQGNSFELGNFTVYLHVT